MALPFYCVFQRQIINFGLEPEAISKSNFPLDFLGRADVRTYSGDLYNQCSIWFGQWPREVVYHGSGQEM